MENHIRAKRLWESVNTSVELTMDELTHLCRCELCLTAFKVCVMAKTESAVRQRDDHLPKSA